MGFFDNFWNDAGVKKYGLVKYPSGRTGYRNYGRELKNGKGVSLRDRVVENVTRNNALFLRLQAKANETPDGVLVDEPLRYGDFTEPRP